MNQIILLFFKAEAILHVPVASPTEPDAPPLRRNISISWPAFELSEQNITTVRCCSLHCIKQKVSLIARPWRRKPVQQWCRSHLGDNNTLSSGLLFVKVPKSASSTIAGIILRVSHNHQCHVQWKHRKAIEYSIRKVEESFLLAPIRQAASRALSSFYYHHVTFHGKHQRKNPSDAYAMRQLQKLDSNYILDYTVLQPLPSFLPETDDCYIARLLDEVKAVLRNYDFLVIVERLEESLIVFAWLTGLQVADLLFVSSKESGSWYHSGRRCIPLAKPVMTPELERFFHSKAWLDRQAGDVLLYMAANESLDRTIDMMGHDRFEHDRHELRRLQSLVQKVCANETFLPCSSTGQPQLELSRASCYIRDFGCGYACLDQIVSKNFQAS